MTALAVTLYRTRPDEEPVPEVTSPLMLDELDLVMESTKCACAASDDNPF
jgi:hypothetical protein